MNVLRRLLAFFGLALLRDLNEATKKSRYPGVPAAALTHFRELGEDDFAWDVDWENPIHMDPAHPTIRHMD